MTKRILFILTIVVLLPILYFLSEYNYNLYHLIVELFTGIIAILIFAVSVISKKYKNNPFIERLGYGMLSVFFIVIIHAITYKGLNFISGYDSNLPTQLWVILSYIQCISIFVAIVFYKVKIKSWILVISYLAVAIVATTLSFMKVFPVSFIMGIGLSPFKIISEYIIIFIYTICVYLLFTKRKEDLCKQYKLFSLSLVLMMISGFMFTFFLDLYATMNFLGHYIRFIAFILIGISVVIEDIQRPYEDLVESKKMLADSEKKYHSIYDFAAVGICTTSIEGKMLNTNKKFCDILGYSKEELNVVSFLKITHPDDIDLSKEIFNKLLNDEPVNGYIEKRYIHKNGKIIYVALTAKMIKDSNGNNIYTVTTIQDISEQKKLEKDNRNMESQLRNQQKLASIGVLASGVAHEINNPINGIMNYGQLILDASQKGTEFEEYSKEIMHETNRVSDIVKKLLSFSRQEVIGRDSQDVAEIIHQTYPLIQSILRKDQISLSVSINKDIPPIICNSQQIQQVIMNLLTNARDALNKKYEDYDINKKIIISCKIDQINNNDYVVISVTDFGSGISLNDREKIFDPFFTTKGRDQGTGLGLSISYGIVKDHGGILNFETEVGEYTKFNIKIPINKKGI